MGCNCQELTVSSWTVETRGKKSFSVTSNSHVPIERQVTVGKHIYDFVERNYRCFLLVN